MDPTFDCTLHIYSKHKCWSIQNLHVHPPAATNMLTGEYFLTADGLASNQAGLSQDPDRMIKLQAVEGCFPLSILTATLVFWSG